MKAYIGPYPTTHVTMHTFYKKYMEWKHKKYYFAIEDSEETKLDHFVDTICDMVDKTFLVPVNKVLSKRDRKIRIHIDNYDVWNADYTIALIVLPILRKLKEEKHGSPYVDDEDVPEHLRSTAAAPKENEWDSDSLLEARWEYVLNEMIHTFECEANPDWEDQFYSGEHDIVWEKLENGLNKMTKGPNDTFEVDHEGMSAAWVRRKEGLRLFGKYYHGLWD
jgi:hypothetical protein